MLHTQTAQTGIKSSSWSLFLFLLLKTTHMIWIWNVCTVILCLASVSDLANKLTVGSTVGVRATFWMKMFTASNHRPTFTFYQEQNPNFQAFKWLHEQLTKFCSRDLIVFGFASWGKMLVLACLLHHYVSRVLWSFSTYQRLVQLCDQIRLSLQVMLLLQCWRCGKSVSSWQSPKNRILEVIIPLSA